MFRWQGKVRVLLEGRVGRGDQAKLHPQDRPVLVGNAHAIPIDPNDPLCRIVSRVSFFSLHGHEVEGTDTVDADRGEPLDVFDIRPCRSRSWRGVDRSL